VEDLPKELLLVSPALCYRRDVIDKIHVAEPHQLDLWRIRRGPLDESDLREMIGCLVENLLPGRDYRLLPAQHPYTTHGHQIDVKDGEDWVEIGECGVASQTVLQHCGLPHGSSGLAAGIGLDRILMLRKRIPDIRLLRSEDPRVASQMLDLQTYKIVSNLPAIPRDLSIAVREDMTSEEMGDVVRTALEEDVGNLEDLIVLSQTPYEDLPPSALARMGIKEGQKNVLLRLVIRHVTKTLTAEEANRIRDRVYLELHQGTKNELASR
jgi:phenylalanyl-tRNA synthetase alpha chain